MTPVALRRACLAMPGATETFPFGPENSVFRVAGKIFALSRLHRPPPSTLSWTRGRRSSHLSHPMAADNAQC